MNLDSFKAAGSNCIPEVVLKNCGPELSDTNWILQYVFEGVIGGCCV